MKYNELTSILRAIREIANFPTKSQIGDGYYSDTTFDIEIQNALRILLEDSKFLPLLEKRPEEPYKSELRSLLESLSKSDEDYKITAAQMEMLSVIMHIGYEKDLVKHFEETPTIKSSYYKICSGFLSKNKTRWGLSPKSAEMLKKIPLDRVTFSEPRKPNQYYFGGLDIFDICDSKIHCQKVAVSNRMASCGELRGDVLRNIILAEKQEKQENPDISVYQAIYNGQIKNYLNVLQSRHYNEYPAGSTLPFTIRFIFDKYSEAGSEKHMDYVVNKCVSLCTSIESINYASKDADLTTEEKAALSKVKELESTLNNYAKGIVNIESLFESGNQVVRSLQKNNSGYKDLKLKKALINLATVLISFLTLGIANLVSYATSGRFMLFNKQRSHLSFQTSMKELDASVTAIMDTGEQPHTPK